MTQEKVDSVLPDGRVTIRGTILPVTGRVPILPGETVAVAWRDGKMDVVMLNQGRRGGASINQVISIAGIVEELYLDDSTIWLRNEHQMSPLLSRTGETALKASDLGLDRMSAVHWGKGDASTLCVEGRVGADVVWVIAKLNRATPNEPFPNGAKIRAIASQSYNLSSDISTFGSYTVTVSATPLSDSATETLKLVAPQISASIGSNITVRLTPVVNFAGVAPNGDLLVTLVLSSESSGGGGVGSESATLGALLFNVTRGVLLANHLASELSTIIYPSSVVGTVTLPDPPPCQEQFVVTIQASFGGAIAEAGDITVLSLKAEGTGNQAVGTFNNYAVIGPAWIQANSTLVFPFPLTRPFFEVFCAAPRASLVIRIFGEHQGVIPVTFEGSTQGPASTQLPLIQGSRTMVLIGTVSQSLLTSMAPLRIAWLPTMKLSTIQGSSSFDAFDSGSTFSPFFPAQWLQARAYFVTQASLIYSPRESLPYPFGVVHRSLVGGRPQFVSGFNRASGIAKITMIQPKATLPQLGPLFVPRTPPQKATSIGVPLADLQVLNSRVNLGNLFQSGPL